VGRLGTNPYDNDERRKRKKKKIGVRVEGTQRKKNIFQWGSPARLGPKSDLVAVGGARNFWKKKRMWPETENISPGSGGPNSKVGHWSTGESHNGQGWGGGGILEGEAKK